MRAAVRRPHPHAQVRHAVDYLGEFQNDWGGAMAASIVTSVPSNLAFTLLQRFFVQGLTAGAVKS